VLYTPAIGVRTLELPHMTSVSDLHPPVRVYRDSYVDGSVVVTIPARDTVVVPRPARDTVVVHRLARDTVVARGGSSYSSFTRPSGYVTIIKKVT